MIIVRKGDSGRELQVRSGDLIQVELGGSGGAGYWWYVTSINPEYVELASEETKPPSDPKLLGGPVTGIWRFKVKEPGKTEVVMKYYRVWQGPEKAEDQFSLTLNIR